MVYIAFSLEAMLAHGWKVEVACSPGLSSPKLDEIGVVFHPVAIARNRNLISHVYSIFSLVRLLKRQSYDVVIVHTPIASLVGRLAAKIAGIPLVIYTAHGFYFHENMAPFRRSLHVNLERLFGLLTDHLFTVSNEDAQTAVLERIMPPQKVTCIGNGIKLERFQKPNLNITEEWRHRLDLPKDALVIGIIGRVVREKGFLEFFESAKRLTKYHTNLIFLVIGGEVEGDRDPFSHQIQQLLKLENLFQYVRFTGFTEDVAEILHLMDILFYHPIEKGCQFRSWKPWQQANRW